MPLKLAEKQLSLPFKGETYKPLTERERLQIKFESVQEQYAAAEQRATRLYRLYKALQEQLKGEGVRERAPKPAKKATKKPAKPKAKR